MATYIAIIPAVLAIAGIIFVIIKNIKDFEYKKMMKEAMFAVAASAVIGTITGVTLSKGEVALELYPQLLVAFPALIDTLGDQNAIFANMLITDFSAGYVEPELKSVKKPKVWAIYLGIGAGGLVVTFFLGIIGTLIKLSTVRAVSAELGIAIIWLILLVMIVTLIANILAFIIVGSLMFVLSIFAFAMLPGVGEHETATEVIRALISATAVL